MKVGALEESVTVSGASPVVDVQTNAKSQVLSRDVLDAVPSAKTIQSLGQLVVGVTPQLARRRRLARDAADLLRGARRRRVAARWCTVDGLITNGTDGRRRGAGVPQRSDDPGSRLPDRGRRGRNDHRRHQHEPRAEGRRQPVPRRRSSAAKSPERGRATT